MKKRLIGQLMLLSCLGIGCTLAILCTVFFGIYRAQVLEDLRTSAHLLQGGVSAADPDRLREDEALASCRITWIDAEGNVLFDSRADTQEMENHADRPEVEEAREQGWGSAVRESDTMGRNTYYYALLLENGQVLRVAQEAGSLWIFLFRALPLLLLLLGLTFLACWLASRAMTRRFMAPIEALVRGGVADEDTPVYREMEPLVTTIRKQHEEILRASNLQREFTANVTHELKTPLTAISGYAELIENGLAPAGKTGEFAAEIGKNVRRLQSLIDDIMRLSQLDSPVEEVYFEHVNLTEVVRDAEKSQQLAADAAGVTLTAAGPEEAWICASREMMEELVGNLLSNAIRYNYRGGTVRISVTSSREAVELCVQDTGIGIPKEEQERIFERFYRVDKSRSRSLGGTGLGLSIVRNIAERHDAKIEIASEVGRGTTFRVRFPVETGK